MTLAVGVTYYLVFADRIFSSYDGARLGMTVGGATRALELRGWTFLPSSSANQHADCSENEHYFVQLRSPDYSLILASDDDCKVSSIARKRRGIEL